MPKSKGETISSKMSNSFCTSIKLYSCNKYKRKKFRKSNSVINNLKNTGHKRGSIFHFFSKGYQRMRLEVLNTVHFLLFDILKHVDMGIKGCVLKSWIRSIFCFLIFQNMLIWVSKDASWRAEYGPFFFCFLIFQNMLKWVSKDESWRAEYGPFSGFWYFKNCSIKGKSRILTNCLPKTRFLFITMLRCFTILTFMKSVFQGGHFDTRLI